MVAPSNVVLHDKVLNSGVLTETQLSEHHAALIDHLKNPDTLSIDKRSFKPGDKNRQRQRHSERGNCSGVKDARHNECETEKKARRAHAVQTRRPC